RIPDGILRTWRYAVLIALIAATQAGLRNRTERAKHLRTRIHYAHRKLRAEIATKVVLRDDNARFDFDLRLGLVENRDQLANRFDVLFDVGNNQRIAAAVDFDRAAARQTAFDNRENTLVATATRGIAACAAAEAEVGRTASVTAGRAGSLGQRARRARVVQTNELSNQRRAVK